MTFITRRGLVLRAWQKVPQAGGIVSHDDGFDVVETFRTAEAARWSGRGQLPEVAAGPTAISMVTEMSTQTIC